MITNIIGVMPIPKTVRVMNISTDGYLILRCSDDIGMPKRTMGVFDKRNRKIARVMKIFGPTRAPYIKAKPTGNKERLVSLVGRDMYLK